MTRTITDLRHYGYTEEEIVNHTIAWINYTVAFETHREIETIKLHEKLELRHAILIGTLFHDPDKGFDLYRDMLASLDGENSTSDETFLSNPNASTDLSALEHMLRKKSDEQRRKRDEHQSTR